MKLEHKRILVVGSGLSGIAAVKLLDSVGADIVLYDGNEKLSEQDVKNKLPRGIKLEIILGSFPREIINNLDLAILSPGVPTDLDYVNEMRTSGIIIWGEVELAYQFAKGKVAAITGTNGKTTTTALTGEIMRAYYDSVFVVGNIGMPYTDVALSTKENSVTVAEMSSFQLETIDEFRPNVSAILNITPDHLNRHHTMENYIEAKVNITKNQGQEDTCVLNYEDDELRKIADSIKAKVFYFSSKRKLKTGIYLDKDGNIIYSKQGEEIVVCNIKELKLLGTHNYENVMAGVAIAIHLQVPMKCIQNAIISFTAVEHRIEYVTEKNGVKYYNDSKGTNPDAAIKGIQAMVTPTLLIGGGYDKESEYEEWIKSFNGKVKYLVLLGQTREKIAKAAKKCGFKNIIMVDSLQEAVEVCAKKAESGEAVLLSPACASWGMFKNYEERGRLFKEYVNNLK